MKKLLLFLFLSFYTILSFGQQAAAPAPVSPRTDSTKSTVHKVGKIKMVYGTPMNSSKDFMYNFSLSNNYSIFLKAIRNSGLTETFKSRGPITVFVPDNSAFSYMPAGSIDTLLTNNHKLELESFITYHAVPGILKAKDIANLIKNNSGQAVLITISGAKLTAHIDVNRNIVLVDESGGESIISTFDIPQSNGIAHIITRVLIPKYKVI